MKTKLLKASRVSLMTILALTLGQTLVFGHEEREGKKRLV
jgi:hypothetical protein